MPIIVRSVCHLAAWGEINTTFYQHGLILLPAWINNHMFSQVWDEFIRSETLRVETFYLRMGELCRPTLNNVYGYLSI